MKVKRMMIGLLMLGFVVIIGLFSGKTVAASSSKTLNIIGWSEYVPQDVLDTFSKKSGIKINYTSFSDPSEMLAKVQSSAKGTYDLILAPGMYVDTFNKLGRLGKIDQSKLTNFKNLVSTSISQDYDKNNQYSVPYLGTVMGIAVNTKEYQGKIDSYQDLLKKALRRDIVTVEDERVVVGIALMATGHHVNDTSAAALKDAKAYLKKLKPNIKIFDGTSPKTSMINGEVAVGLMYGGEIAIAMQEDPDIKVYYPKEDISFQYDVFMELKDAKNAAGATAFINYILEPKVSEEISEAFPYYNPNAAATKLLPSYLKNNIIVNVPKSVLKRTQTVGDIGDDTDKVDAVWSSFKNTNY